MIVTKFQDVIFTAIMATIMVYGMIVYNVALNMGGVRGETFIAALHEMPIMVPIAFILEFFVVGKLARMLAFTVIKFLGENPGTCPWDEAKKYFSKSLMSISSEYILQI